MSTDCYRTYFDAATRGPALEFLATGYAFIAIGVVLFVWVRIRGGRYWPSSIFLIRAPRYDRFFTIIWLGFAIVWTTFASIGVFGDYVSDIA